MSTLGKALEINLDPLRYGTFAEIGAGQEVARFFFQAGKASQTIAKTISAYDMIYSDEIYGKERNGRYVCESRLNKMLDKEFSLLQRRLSTVRGNKTCFFAFANTVAAGDAQNRKSHGWMGVRFQQKPGGPHNDIIMHVRMLDQFRLQQQEALGILGVNLISAAFYSTKNSKDFFTAITDSLKEGRIAIDTIRFSGEDLKHLDTRLMNLELVKRNLTEAVLFDPEGQVQYFSDVAYGKAVFIQRGAFRPVTNVNLQIQEQGLRQFKKENKLSDTQVLPLFEITMHSLQDSDKKINEQDFLDRVDTLVALKQHVLVSNFFLFFQMRQFVHRYSQLPMGIVIGASHLEKIFKPEYYSSLEGGLLEGLSKLLSDKCKLYVYPFKDKNICLTTKSFFPPPALVKIYEHFTKNGEIVDIADCDDVETSLHSEEVRQMMKKKDPKWEKLVPPEVRDLIKKKSLFGFKS